MRLGAVPRITLGLVSLAVALLLVFDLALQMFPREVDAQRRARAQLAESLAVQMAELVQAGDRMAVARTLEVLRARHADIESIGLRRHDGQLLAHAGDHPRRWPHPGDAPGTEDVVVGLRAGTVHWGDLEIDYAPLTRQALAEGLFGPQARLVALFTVFASLLFFVYLRRVLHHLDPSTAVPGRVGAAFDALSDGVVIIDPRERILLANQSFEALAPPGRGGRSLLGRRLSALGWLACTGGSTDADAAPWRMAMHSRQALRGLPFRIVHDGEHVASLLLNCSPLGDERAGVRGCLVTVDDVTALERSNAQLSAALSDLAASKQALERKNLELEDLASLDALSGCLNRRAFFVGLERLFEEARRVGGELVCVLADIDFFKKINDNHGHAIGDEAIQCFAAILRGSVRQGDLVGRYGGEEFCIAVPGMALERALALAETLRQRVAAEEGVGRSAGQCVRMTASFGVATLRHDAANVAELVDQADRAMYRAKQSGRNRVVAYGHEVEAGRAQPEQALA